jgi:hypothetical protein
MDRRLKLHDAWIYRPALRLDLALVPGAQVDALHNHPVFFRFYADNLTAFSFVIRAAADDFYSVAFANLRLHILLLPALEHFRC